MCRGSRDAAISALKSLLSQKVHVNGSFRIENSKSAPFPYVYMVCKICRDAKCGIEQRGAESTWYIKSVTTALGSPCLGGHACLVKPSAAAAVNQMELHGRPSAAAAVNQMELHGAATSPATLAAKASAIAVAAVESIDLSQLLNAVSPAKVQCTNCHELREEGDFARCGNSTHRFCSNCFCNVVGNAVGGENKGVFIASRGLVPCTWCTPNSSCDVQRYAALLSKDCFQAWLDAVAAMKVEEESSKWAERLKQKDEEHFQVLVKAGAASEDMQVQRHYDHIADTLIQPSCPVCHMYIVEFDACCALQCGRRDGAKWAVGNGCGAYICAWCLTTQVSEKELNEHVKLCSYNPSRGSMFPPAGHPREWDYVMHEFARKRVKEYITAKVPSGLQKQVYLKVQTSNPEIGLGLQTWGTVVSDTFRPSRDVRPPRQPSLEDNVTTLLTMQIVDNRQQALTLLEASSNNIDTAITFALAQRQQQ